MFRWGMSRLPANIGVKLRIIHPTKVLVFDDIKVVKDFFRYKLISERRPQLVVLIPNKETSQIIIIHQNYNNVVETRQTTDTFYMLSHE